MLLNSREQHQVDLYRQLRERFHEGPYYSVLDAASSSAKKGSAARANYDPFHGMPSYSGRYQKKKRTLPKVQGRSYSESWLSLVILVTWWLWILRVGCFFFFLFQVMKRLTNCFPTLVMKFFPRELWQTIQPSFKPDSSLDGFVPQVARGGTKRGFEDVEQEEEDLTRRRRGPGGEEEDDSGDREGEGDIPDPDEEQEQEEEIVDSDFEDDDDEMGGDYNAEQYFDGGDDEYGDDGFGDGGGGGGDEDTF